MIKVYVKNKQIVIKGHADYADFGKDIVCASASSIVTTSINAALRFDNKSIIYKYELDKLVIDIKSDEESILLIMENMVAMLEELAFNYKQNIKIIKED